MFPLADLLPALAAGIVAGLGVAVPVGAIGVLVVDLGIRGGFRAAWPAALGVATADLLYAAAAAVAGAGLAVVVAPVQDPLRLVGAALLAGIAVHGLLAARRRRDGSGRATRGGFARFLALTLVNPATALYFAVLLTGLPDLDGTADRVLFVAGAFAASAAWQTTLAAGGAALGHALPPSARWWTSVAGSVIVLALAVHLAIG